MRLFALLLLTALLCGVYVQAACGDSTNSVLSSGVCFCKDGYWIADAQVSDVACNKCPTNTYSWSGFTNTKTDMTEAKACSSCAPNYYFTTTPAAGQTPTCIKCPGKATSNGGSKVGISVCSCNNIRMSDTNNTCEDVTTSASYIAFAFSALLFIISF